MRAQPWTSRAWGIGFCSDADVRGGSQRLLGYGWIVAWKLPPFLSGQLQIIAFRTRAEARIQARAMRKKYHDYPLGHACRGWHFRATPILITARSIR